jgi:hypothetical protein
MNSRATRQPEAARSTLPVSAATICLARSISIWDQRRQIRRREGLFWIISICSPRNVSNDIPVVVYKHLGMPGGAPIWFLDFFRHRTPHAGWRLPGVGDARSAGDAASEATPTSGPARATDDSAGWREV